MFDEGTTTSRPRDVEEPVRTLDDVIVSERVRRQILRAITGVKQHDLIYNQWGIKGIDPHGGCVAVNMFGPPGTGKSMCAEAIAHELGKPLMRVNYAQLESKFVGDTPKNIQNVFRQAYHNDAVLFFDEADSILGARLTKVDHGVDQEFNVSRSVMLQELEHFDGVVLFATNLASQYDAAFRRRMEHIEFCLPGHRSRLKLWKHMLVDKVDGKLPLDAVIDFDALAEHSKGLSGGDIQQVVLRAARTAATRPKEKQMISTDDLLQEVVHAFSIKEKVGQST
jgi:ATP-dependent 26S proteasome regulatory subunit